MPYLLVERLVVLDGVAAAAVDADAAPEPGHAAVAHGRSDDAVDLDAELRVRLVVAGDGVPGSRGRPAADAQRGAIADP